MDGFALVCDDVSGGGGEGRRLIQGASVNGGGQVALRGRRTRNTDPWWGTVVVKECAGEGMGGPRSRFAQTSRSCTGPVCE